MTDVELLPLPWRLCHFHDETQLAIKEYARANVEHHTAVLRAEMDALARENEAMKRCATKYLEWLGVTHMPLDQALRDDMLNPRMCGDAALAQEDRNV